MQLLLGTCVFFLSVLTVQCAKNVTISKCCKFDEFLASTNKCMYSVKNTWVLKVFSKGTLNAQDRVPPNWHLKEGYKPNCSSPALYTANFGNYISFQNGSLYMVAYDKLVHPNDYCIDYNSVLVCHGQNELQSMSLPRIMKCCGKDAIFSQTNQTCISLRDPSYHIDLGKNKTLIAGFPTCNEHKMALVGRLEKDKAVIQDNGSLWLAESKMLLPVGNYCLEHVLENRGRAASIMICEDDLQSTVTIEATQPSDLRFTIYPMGLALSAVFLAATLAAVAFMPGNHHFLYWRCLNYHVACLMAGDVLLCIVQLTGKISPAPCFIIAVCMHFLFLAAFFWLNTMCFNIWWTFRDLRPQSVEKSQEKCRLRLYEAYAWGMPFLIAGTGFILDVVPGAGPESLRPKFGTNSCWFDTNSKLEILTFFFGPVGVILLVNVALFALTARELTCGLWKPDLVKSTSERAALRLVCMKLVVVMGVTWIADVISWIVGGPQEVWYLTDIINCLHGVFIFIAVGTQPQVLSAVKRLWCLRKHGENGTAGTTNHHSSSSQGLPSVGDTVTNNSITHNTTKSIPLETSC